jgi:hypothetical protein
MALRARIIFAVIAIILICFAIFAIGYALWPLGNADLQNNIPPTLFTPP